MNSIAALKRCAQAWLVAITILLGLATNGRADLSTGLVARYPLNGNGEDASGMGRSLTATGITYTSAQSGGKAASFNGQTSYFRYISPITTSNSFTWTCWFKVDADVSFATGSVNLMNQGGNPGQGGTTPSLHVQPDWRLRFATYDTEGRELVSAAGAVTPGGWHFAAVTSDTSGNRALYLNGTQVASATGQPFGQQQSNFYLGASASYGNHNMLKGALDDVRIYSRALSAADVSTLVTAGPNTDATPPSNVGLIGWMRFDSNFIIDNTSTAYADMFLVPDPVLIQDPARGRVAQFLGRDGYLTLRPRSYFSPGTDDYSVAAWIKWPQRQNGEVDQPLAAIFTAFNMVQPGAAGATWVQLTGDTATGRIQFGLRPGGGNGTQTVIASSSNVRTGQWVHVAGVRRGQHTVEIWVNGVREGQLTNTSLSNVNLEAADSYGQFDPNAPAYVGYNPGYTGADFRGWMDDLRIYRRALASSEIINMAGNSLLEVSNVKARQGGFGSKFVDIDYDLGANTGFPVSVSLEISDDAGVTWSVPSQSTTNDIGSNVTPGNGKTIRWNAGADWNLRPPTVLRFRVVAVQSAGHDVAGTADAEVDTSNGSSNINVTIRRLTASAFSRPDWSVATLRDDIKKDSGVLRSQPQVQGLVADGVTPLLFHIHTNRTFSEPWMLAANFFKAGTANDVQVDLDQPNRWFLIQDGRILPENRFDFTNSSKEAFLILLPLASHEVPSVYVVSDAIGGRTEYLPRSELKIWRGNVKLLEWPTKNTTAFYIRKPPVALVHGYNADNSTWSDTFKLPLQNDRGSDFVIPVEYGTESLPGINKKNDINTYEGLGVLAKLLHDKLRDEIENALIGGQGPGNSPLREWAGTRYDCVGHSQGGVLLRLLCSKELTSGLPLEQIYGFPSFKNHRNHNEGRFHRVVTVGSPHFGSTSGHVGKLLYGNALFPLPIIPLRVGGRFWFRRNLPNEQTDWWLPFDIVEESSREVARAAINYVNAQLNRLLQPKFSISSADSGSIAYLNTQFICDQSAQMHLIGTTIYGGQQPQFDDNLPNIYRALWMEGIGKKCNTGPSWEDDTGIGATNKSSGELVAPLGGDGVVDLRSQLGLTSNALQTSPLVGNRSRISGFNISHSQDPVVATVFGTGISQTSSSLLATKILEVIGSTSPSAFGPFSSPSESQDLRNELDHDAERLTHFAASAVGAYLNEPIDLAIPQQPTVPLSSVPLNSEDKASQFSADYTAEYFTYTFQPAPSHPRVGNVSWTATVFGPGGPTQSGVSLNTSGEGATTLTITVGPAVSGQVVLDVSYSSAAGKVISGRPIIVTSRFPGSLQSVELRPGAISVSPGTEVPLQLWGVFSEGTAMPLFAVSPSTEFASSNTTVSTVTENGIARLLAAGSCVIQASYNGTHTATTSVTVLGPLPVITSPATASGQLGQPFIHTMSATGVGLTFSATDLPAGLSMNSAGVISGSPTAEGEFPATIIVTNGESRSTQQTLVLTITAPNEPPSAVSLTSNVAPSTQPAGTVVGSLVTTDPNPLDTFTYSLVAGAGADHNSLFVISGNTLITSATLNGGSMPQCSIRVRSQDSGGASVEQVFVLPVLGAPVVTQQPSGFALFVDETGQLLVAANGYGPLAYQWLRNGVEVSGGTSPVLDITGSTVGTASYQARISNTYGQVISAPAIVTTRPKSFGRWAAERSSGTTLPTVDGDSNADGIANAFDFAFGTDPSQTRNVMPKIEHRSGSPAFIYRLAGNIELTRLRILVSNNLSNWQEHIPLSGDVITRGNPDGSSEVEVRLPLADSRLFVRLEVTP